MLGLPFRSTAFLKTCLRLSKVDYKCDHVCSLWPPKIRLLPADFLSASSTDCIYTLNICSLVKLPHFCFLNLFIKMSDRRGTCLFSLASKMDINEAYVRSVFLNDCILQNLCPFVKSKNNVSHVCSLWRPKSTNKIADVGSSFLTDGVYVLNTLFFC
jgi:hypothetical protein